MDDFSYYQNNLTLDSLHHNYKFHLWDHRHHCHYNAFQCQGRIHLKVIVDILEIWSKLYNLLIIFTFTSVPLKSFIAYAGSNCIITNSLVWTEAILWTIKFCRDENFMFKKLLDYCNWKKDNLTRAIKTMPPRITCTFSNVGVTNSCTAAICWTF